jgi:hypothetical protein
MVSAQIGLGVNGKIDDDLKEKSDAIKDSLTFDFPILFKANELNVDETQKTNPPLKTKHLLIPNENGMVRRNIGNLPQSSSTTSVTLSWENVNVFKKNEFKFKNIFKSKRKTKDSSYLLHKDLRKKQTRDDAIKTISFTRNAGENQSLESLSSNSSTTSNSSSSSSSSSTISKYYETNQILFNGKHI